jgi:hypothetical protein
MEDFDCLSLNDQRHQKQSNANEQKQTSETEAVAVAACFIIIALLSTPSGSVLIRRGTSREVGRGTAKIDGTTRDGVLPTCRRYSTTICCRLDSGLLIFDVHLGFPVFTLCFVNLFFSHCHIS